MRERDEEAQTTTERETTIEGEVELERAISREGETGE